MSLPTISTLATLGFSLNGLPFCAAVVGQTNNPQTMNWSLDAYPFVVNSGEVSTQTVTLTETSPTEDSLAQIITITLEELSPTEDSETNPVFIELSETSPTEDSLGDIQATIYLEETSPTEDDVFLQPISLAEESPTADELYEIITIYLEEVSPTEDSLGAPALGVALSEVSPTTDSVDTPLLVSLTETSPTTDSVAPFIVDSLEVTVVVQVLEYNQTQVGNTIQVNEFISHALSQVNINTLANNLVATTNATAVGNVFEPTFILNGEVIYSNAATLPPASSIANARCYVNLNCNAISGISLTEVYNWNLNFDYYGGSFTIVSKNQIGALGEQLSIFGYTGTITRVGRERSNSADGWKTSGIFGSPQLHKQLSLSIYGNPIVGSNVTYNGLLPNQALYVPNLSAWTTHKAAAQYIAAAAGVSLNWIANDVKLTDFFPQVGQTALYALNSLAQEVGAVLRWNGNNSYTVAYPNKTLGSWTVPDCCLMGAAGISYETVLDLETGISGVGITALPYMPEFNAATKEIVNPTATANSTPAIQQVGSLRKIMQVGEPFQIIPLPDDYYKVYAQCLVGAANNGTPDLSGANYVTTNPGNWTPISPSNLFTTIGIDPLNPSASNQQIQDAINESNSSLTGIYLVETVQGNTRQTVLVVDYRVFTNVLGSNTSVQGGYFSLNFGIARLSMDGFFNAAQKQSQKEQEQILFKESQRYRFIPTYNGSINSTLFGSLPVPGMKGTGTIGDFSVTGVIESMSFSYPASIAVSVTQYRVLDFYSAPLSQIIAFNGL